MIWIVIGGLLCIGVVAWAQSSRKSVEAAEAERRERQKERLAEAALLAKLNQAEKKDE